MTDRCAIAWYIGQNKQEVEETIYLIELNLFELGLFTPVEDTCRGRKIITDNAIVEKEPPIKKKLELDIDVTPNNKGENPYINLGTFS